MNELYDYRKIEYPFNESYIGYGNDNFSEMDDKKLLKEYNAVISDIKELRQEVTDLGDKYTSFSIKEQIENAEDYLRRIKIELGKRHVDLTTESASGTLTIQDMINDLNKKYTNGKITKSYRDKYISKLSESKERNEKKLKEEKKKLKKQLECDKNKPYIFKLFKNKLSDYKK